MKCYKCRRKLIINFFDCECGHTFCFGHMQSFEHQCPVDYTTKKKTEIQKNNPRITKAKVPLI